MATTVRRFGFVLASLGVFAAVSISHAGPGRLLVAGADAGYVDPARCAGCHREIAENYARTGMSRSFRSVSGDSLPEFDGKTFYHSASQQYFTPDRRDGRFYLRRHQIGFEGSVTNVLEREVRYIFGSGNHARSYLHRTSGGKLIELPVTWYSEGGGYWGMSPAYDRPDHRGFSREISYRCLFCHNGYPEIEAGSDDWEFSTEFPGRLPEGIDCQRCHGPGRDHVQAVERGAAPRRVRDSIVNPARLSPERQMELCMQCHLESTSSRLPATLLRHGRGVFSYRPGEPLANYVLYFDQARGTGHDDKFELVSAAYRLRKSACFQSSRGTLTCTTCHDPHNALRGQQATRQYTQACERCHSRQLAPLVEERKHPAATECISCHMPRRRPSDAIHIVITDHYIHAWPAGGPPAPVQEEHDGNTPPYAGEVALYYPPALPRTPENDLDLAVAQITQQANLPEGLRRLERAIEQYRPNRGDVYFELADAWFRAEQAARAIPLYEQAVKRAPDRWRYLGALGIALAAAGQPGRASESLRRAQSLAPREVAVLYALADIYSSSGRLPEAVATLRKVAALNPEMAEASNNLGMVLLQLGDLTGAEAAFREAARLRPEMAAIHVNLSSVLVQKGNLPEAKYRLERAIQTGPSRDQARSAYLAALVSTGEARQALREYDTALGRQLSDRHNNLGTVLAGLGDADGAIGHYRLAIAARPDSALAHFNLGLTLAGKGELSEARVSLEKALQYAPDSLEAHLKLGEVLMQQGRAELATPHLRRAAQSSDPRLRKAAADLLARTP